METLRIRRKLATINRDSHEDHLRNNQARNTNSPRIQEAYITQVSEEIEGRLAKKLSQGFNGTKSCVLGALSRPDEFILNPQALARSGPVPETSRNSSRENRETNGDHTQNDPHPEAAVSLSQSLQELSPEETSYTSGIKEME